MSDEIMSDEWRAIPGLLDYEISPHGVIRRARPGKNTAVGRIKRTHANSRGYLIAQFLRDGKAVARPVHQLVALAYIGPRPGDLHVLHNDGDKLNNHYTNLRYGTSFDNMRDKALHGTSSAGEANGRAKLTPDQVLRIRAETRNGKAAAATYGISHTQYCAVKRGANWGHVSKEQNHE